MGVAALASRGSPDQNSSSDPYWKELAREGPPDRAAGLRDQSCITTDLYAGVQLVLPGEMAPAHRYTQSALRFVLEGNGAYTAVNGEKTIMHKGDFIITPPMAWHDHGNPSDAPIFWLDGLDIPVISFLDTSFAEHLEVDEQPITRPVGDSDARYGADLLPVVHEASTQVLVRGVVHHLLAQHTTDAHANGTMLLALDDGRVQDGAAILGELCQPRCSIRLIFSNRWSYDGEACQKLESA